MTTVIEKEEEQYYTPSQNALYQRKYRGEPHTSGKCMHPICKKQRAVSTVPRGMIYKLYYRCVGCKTNWSKLLLRCPHCGYLLRRSARKKTPYNERPVF